jgi:uncharacterized membrane protein YqiK
MQLFDLGGLIPIMVVGGLIIAVPLLFGGLVVISERKSALWLRNLPFPVRGLPPGRLIALDGEAGYQADTLAPGWHWGYWPWQYNVRKESLTIVPQGEIALVVAADGALSRRNAFWEKSSPAIISRCPKVSQRGWRKRSSVGYPHRWNLPD